MPGVFLARGGRPRRGQYERGLVQGAGQAVLSIERSGGRDRIIAGWPHSGLVQPRAPSAARAALERLQSAEVWLEPETFLAAARMRRPRFLPQPCPASMQAPAGPRPDPGAPWRRLA